MRYNFFKLTTLLAAVVILLMTYSCVKTRAGYTDLSQVSDLVTLNGAGLSNFKASNVLVNTSSPDTIKKTVTADLASVSSSEGAVTVTIGVDNSVIAAYNAANGTNFQPFPASAFKIVNASINIPGGLQHYGTTTVWIFQNQLDPATSYLLPIAITNGGGKQLSSNQNVIYYNVIGNPLAGNYLHSYWRWNGTSDTTTPANSTVGINVPIVVGPITATSVTLPEYYLEVNFGLGVVLSFTNNAGVLTNPVVSLDANTQATLAANSFQVTALKLAGYQINGTAATKYAGSRFRVYIEVINNAGALRALINQFVKQ